MRRSFDERWQLGLCHAFVIACVGFLLQRRSQVHRESSKGVAPCRSCIMRSAWDVLPFERFAFQTPSHFVAFAAAADSQSKTQKNNNQKLRRFIAQAAFFTEELSAACGAQIAAHLHCAVATWHALRHKFAQSNAALANATFVLLATRTVSHAVFVWHACYLQASRSCPRSPTTYFWLAKGDLQLIWLRIAPKALPQIISGTIGQSSVAVGSVSVAPGDILWIVPRLLQKSCFEMGIFDSWRKVVKQLHKIYVLHFAGAFRQQLQMKKVAASNDETVTTLFDDFLCVLAKMKLIRSVEEALVSPPLLFYS